MAQLEGSEAANRDAASVFSGVDFIVPIFSLYFAIWVPFALYTLVLYFQRRKRFPLRGRHVLVVLMSNVFVLAWMILTLGLLLSSAALKAQLPCNVHRTGLYVATFVFMLCAFALFAIRCFCLFFAFELSKIKSEYQDKQGSGSQKRIGLADSFASDPRIQFFINHHNLVSRPFLKKLTLSVIFFHVVGTFVQLLFVDGSKCYAGNIKLNDGNEDDEGWVWRTTLSGASVLIIIYTSIAVYFSFKYRGFDYDVYEIRREIGRTGYGCAALGVIWICFAFVPPFRPWAAEVFPLDRFTVMLASMVFHYVQIVIPLQTSYKSQGVGMSQVGSRSISGDGTSKTSLTEGTATQHSVPDRPEAFGVSPRKEKASAKKPSRHQKLDMVKRLLLENPAARDAFKMYLTKEFSVENLMFWERVERQFKKDAELDTLTSLVAQAEQIREEFLQEGALLEVNVSHRLRKAVAQELEQVSKDVQEQDASDTEGVALLRDRLSKLLDEAAYETLKLMSRDSFPRFERTLARDVHSMFPRTSPGTIRRRQGASPKGVAGGKGPLLEEEQVSEWVDAVLSPGEGQATLKGRNLKRSTSVARLGLVPRVDPSSPEGASNGTEMEIVIISGDGSEESPRVAAPLAAPVEDPSSPAEEH